MTIPAAVEDWFKLHDAYHKASDAYNARLAVVRAERERDNWSMNVHAEYRALHDAQSVALQASEALYQYLRADRALTAGERHD